MFPCMRRNMHVPVGDTSCSRDCSALFFVEAGSLAEPSLPGQLAQAISSLPPKGWGYRQAASLTQHLGGFWDPNPESSRLLGKCFTCWAISPAQSRLFNHWKTVQWVYCSSNNKNIYCSICFFLYLLADTKSYKAPAGLKFKPHQYRNYNCTQPHSVFFYLNFFFS